MQGLEKRSDCLGLVAPALSLAWPPLAASMWGTELGKASDMSDRLGERVNSLWPRGGEGSEDLGENRVKRNPRSRTTLQTDEHQDRVGSGMCHLCPIIHLQYEDVLLPRHSRTRDEKLGSLSMSAFDPGKGVPSHPVPGDRPRQRSAVWRGKQEAGLHRKLNLYGRFPWSVPMQSPLWSNLHWERLVHLQPHVLNAAQDLLLVPC